MSNLPPMKGNKSERVLKMTSVLQSWARAWTCVVLMGMQPNQIIPLMMIVASMAPTAMAGRVEATRSPPGRSLVMDSWRIWRKERIIIWVGGGWGGVKFCVRWVVKEEKDVSERTYDGEDEDAQRFETSAADGEFAAEGL